MLARLGKQSVPPNLDNRLLWADKRAHYPLTQSPTLPQDRAHQHHQRNPHSPRLRRTQVAAVHADLDRAQDVDEDDL